MDDADDMQAIDALEGTQLSITPRSLQTWAGKIGQGLDPAQIAALAAVIFLVLKQCPDDKIASAVNDSRREGPMRDRLGRWFRRRLHCSTSQADRIIDALRGSVNDPGTMTMLRGLAEDAA